MGFPKSITNSFQIQYLIFGQIEGYLFVLFLICAGKDQVPGGVWKQQEEVNCSSGCSLSQPGINGVKLYELLHMTDRQGFANVVWNSSL